MKKALYILFSIYFLSLAMIPCGDKGDCNEFKKSQTSQTDHHEEHSDEACTPFCVCSCCASNCVVKEFQSNFTQLAVLETVHVIHEEFSTSSAIISIWQPPKIS